MIEREIEFDPVKDQINLEKHGVGLDAALSIFATPSVEWPSLDQRHGGDSAYCRWLGQRSRVHVHLHDAGAGCTNNIREEIKG